MDYDLRKFCVGLPELKLLVLRNGCFRIEHKNRELDTWCCFEDMAVPLDGFKRILTEVAPNSEYLLFDNQFNAASPAPYLQKLIVRGIILYVMYPEKNAGVVIEDDTKSIGLAMTDYDGAGFTMPLYNAYLSMWNPVTSNPASMLDKMEIVNDNDYAVTVSGMLILGDRDGVKLGDVKPSC